MRSDLRHVLSRLVSLRSVFDVRAPLLLRHPPSPFGGFRLRRIWCQTHVASPSVTRVFSSHLNNAQRPSHQAEPLHINGRGGIRTHGTVSRTPVFKTGSFGRSDTLPNCRNHLLISTKPTRDGPYVHVAYIGYFGCSYHRDPLSTIETHTVRGSQRGSRCVSWHIMPWAIDGQGCHKASCYAKILDIRSVLRRFSGTFANLDPKVGKFLQSGGELFRDCMGVAVHG